MILVAAAAAIMTENDKHDSCKEYESIFWSLVASCRVYDEIDVIAFRNKPNISRKGVSFLFVIQAQ